MYTYVIGHWYLNLDELKIYGVNVNLIKIFITCLYLDAIVHISLNIIIYNYFSFVYNKQELIVFIVGLLSQFLYFCKYAILSSKFFVLLY